MDVGSDDFLPMTDFSKNTINPLRLIAETLKIEPNPNKRQISFQIVDPTMSGYFERPQAIVNAIKQAVEKDMFSYPQKMGLKDARQAVANYFNRLNALEVTFNDVILTSGGSSSLEMCFLAVANPGENILVPRPTFNFSTWMTEYGIINKSYDLDPSRDWEIDLNHLETQIDAKTRAIVVNNVGNPCGNVFSKNHILDVLEIAKRHKLLIISDDVYEFCTFSGVEYHSFAKLSKSVPVLTCSGLTKRFLIPGIRLGWTIISDCGKNLKNIRSAMSNLDGRNLGPNSTFQLALPQILKTVPQSYFDDAMEKVERNAKTAYSILKNISGLVPVMPKGAMNMMIKVEFEHFPKLSSSLEFMTQLANEQSVMVVAGDAFNYPGFVRMVLVVPEEMIIEGCWRLNDFCEKYYQ